jgi:hypothetical protein
MKKWKARSAEEKKRIMEEGSKNYTDMIAAMPKGAESPEAQAVVERWRKHLDYFWTPKLEQLLALANGYNDDPRFKANFDKMHPQLAEFMRKRLQSMWQIRRNKDQSSRIDRSDMCIICLKIMHMSERSKMNEKSTRCHLSRR